jgi:hypothetical protein
MTDKQIAALLVSARADLRKTLEGYVTHPDGPWWSKAMPKLDKAIQELTKAPVPSLGPVLEGDQSMLMYVDHSVLDRPHRCCTCDRNEVREGRPDRPDR